MTKDYEIKLLIKYLFTPLPRYTVLKYQVITQTAWEHKIR